MTLQKLVQIYLTVLLYLHFVIINFVFKLGFLATIYRSLMPVDKKSSLHLIGEGSLLSLPRDWLKRCLQGGSGAAISAIASNTCSMSVVGDTANSELCSSKLSSKTSNNITMAPVSTADSMREDKDRMNISKPRTGELFSFNTPT